MDQGGCYQHCMNINGGEGYLCTCNQGYIVNHENPKMCIDLDECAHGTDMCSQICTNLNGTYSCSCRDGFRIEGASGVCRAVDPKVRNVVVLLFDPTVFCWSLVYENKLKKSSDHLLMI